MSELSNSLKRLGKSISRGKRLSIARSVIENPTLREHIFSLVAIELKNEMKMLTSDKHSSILQMKTKDSLKRFTWECVWLEIETHCPALTTTMKECLPTIVLKKDMTVPSLCVCASILLKL